MQGFFYYPRLANKARPRNANRNNIDRIMARIDTILDPK